jgi:hypothetical protein
VLENILAQDGWSLHAGQIARKADRQIEFYSLKQGDRVLRKAFRAIAQADAGKFQRLGVLVVPTNAELRQVRDTDLAENIHEHSSHRRKNCVTRQPQPVRCPRM